MSLRAKLPDRIEEVARFLWFSKSLGARPGKAIPTYAVTALCFERAGLSARNPDPDAALSWILAFGLGTVERGRLTLSLAGERMLELTDSPLILSKEQKDLMLAQSSEVSWLSEGFTALARWLRRDESGRLILTGSWRQDPELLRYSEVAQQLGLLTQEQGQLLIDEAKLLLLGRQTRVLPLSTKDLERILDSQRQMSLRTELYVVSWEKARLHYLRSSELAETVLHVAPFDVGRGYDIRSVDGGKSGESERFIEVKSSVGAKLEFFVSTHEIDVGKSLGNQYWIYFLPHATGLPDHPTRPILIQNPFGVSRSMWQLTAQSYRVQLNPKMRIQRSEVPTAGSVSGMQLRITQSSVGKRSLTTHDRKL